MTELNDVIRTVAVIVQGTAFWTAVLLPLVWLFLLLVTPSVLAKLEVFWLLIGLNVAVLVVGHGYHGGSGGTVLR